MRADDLFAIDVAAEVATLCGAQIQGPWQVPAELVRLANARGVARVEIDRVRGGFCFRCDGVLADPEELTDLATIFDTEAPRMRRQAPPHFRLTIRNSALQVLRPRFRDRGTSRCARRRRLATTVTALL